MLPVVLMGVSSFYYCLWEVWLLLVGFRVGAGECMGRSLRSLHLLLFVSVVVSMLCRRLTGYKVLHSLVSRRKTEPVTSHSHITLPLENEWKDSQWNKSSSDGRGDLKTYV